ncbi:hypothetical protein MSLAZ_1374 [Methanosarcina lacustris Z-7289]|uniref:Uncharacterized protein n=1 Tax=Methanosarcina lacustris Z-7289 TaxID=1434111 RepID=A0A0E3WR94_9EURY|nr:hypothetical protein MSLAZ_1374 [Methanosarcina lacustris Z-7289]
MIKESEENPEDMNNNPEDMNNNSEDMNNNPEDMNIITVKRFQKPLKGLKNPELIKGDRNPPIPPNHSTSIFQLFI